jgi:2-succinyl-6-hydroxy-2,4-cyclohexadiene-1-carboxylate synthase
VIVTADERSLVLLHGFAQTPASWKPTIDALPAGIKTIAPELPGHGVTALKLGEPSPELARRVALHATERAGRPAVVWGYSQGARVAFDLALEHPEAVSALIIESGVPGIDDPVARADRRSRDFALSTRIEAGSIDDFVAMWERVPALGEQSQATVESQRTDRLRNDPKALAAALRGIGQAAYEPMWDRLAEIGVPVLLITGERDATYTRHAERMLHVLPNARHEVIADASHSVHIAQPAAAAQAAAALVAGLS